MRSFAAVTSSIALASAALAGPGSLPTGPIPDGLGVNIHFTDPRPGEMQMMADAGITWVRMDFVWGATERERGVYDFSAYDRLFAALDAHGIKPLFILDYGNRLYDNDLAPHTDEGRQAMARWAAAVVERYKGRGAIWEMWNEPNIGFWKPRPNPEDYAKLTKAVGDAIRVVGPDETFIGPATSGIDLRFIEDNFSRGLLEHWDAVSVHPYRQQEPETAIAEYARLRQLIEQRAPQGKSIPILSGEWGYSAAWSGFDEDKQGEMLPRQWLTNLSQGVPLSIWYDWHDDGRDEDEPEHHFGTVRHEAREPPATQPVYEPKPAYLAARTLTTQLRGLRFNKRLDVPGRDDVYLLLFADDAGTTQKLAVWTVGEPRDVQLPLGKAQFDRVGHLGDPLAPVRSFRNFPIVHMPVTEQVQYLTPAGGSSDLLRVAAAWEPLPLLIRDRTRRSLPIRTSLRNPLDRPIMVVGGTAVRQTAEPGQTNAIELVAQPARSADPVPVRAAIEIEGLGSISQSTQFLSTNPRRLTIEPAVAGPWSLKIENPSGEAFSGKLTFRVATAQREQPIRFAQGDRENRLPIDIDGGDVSLGLWLDDGEFPAPAIIRTARYRRVGGPVVVNGRMAEGYTVGVEGDEAIRATARLQPLPGPQPRTEAIGIWYEFTEGWRFAVIRPPEGLRAIEGKPSALLMWLYSDGTGVMPRLRFMDAANETFQTNADSGPMNWTGWRLVRFALDGSDSPGRWGGNADGRIDYPIRIETLLLLDNVSRQALTGTARFAGPVLVYE